MHQYSGVLTINLSALRRNWLTLRDRFRGQYCGAVVKANAYGLGVAPVAQSLYNAGCRHFFVATFDEALQVKRLMPASVDIFVLQGVYPGMEQHFCDEGIIPVIYSISMWRRWCDATVVGRRRCALKVDTGMNRLGMGAEEIAAVFAEGDWPADFSVELVMSHLACADEPQNNMNRVQLARFNQIAKVASQRLPGVNFSLANSAGIVLGEDWHFDIARPGIALYGGCCAPALQGLLATVVTLRLPVIQCRQLLPGESVGYGGDFVAQHAMRIIVVSGGYADGILRSLSPDFAAWRGQLLPVVGRISMDSCVFDISHVPPEQRPGEGDWVEFVGPNVSLDAAAEAAGTISYELLTRLGTRLQKVYVEEPECLGGVPSSGGEEYKNG